LGKFIILPVLQDFPCFTRFSFPLLWTWCIYAWCMYASCYARTGRPWQRRQSCSKSGVRESGRRNFRFQLKKFQIFRKNLQFSRQKFWWRF